MTKSRPKPSFARRIENDAGVGDADSYFIWKSGVTSYVELKCGEPLNVRLPGSNREMAYSEAFEEPSFWARAEASGLQLQPSRKIAQRLSQISLQSEQRFFMPKWCLIRARNCNKSQNRNMIKSRGRIGKYTAPRPACQDPRCKKRLDPYLFLLVRCTSITSMAYGHWSEDVHCFWKANNALEHVRITDEMEAMRRLT